MLDDDAWVVTKTVPRRIDRGRVAIHRQQPSGSTESLHDLLGMPAAPKRRIDDAGVGLNGQGRYYLFKEYRDVASLIHVPRYRDNDSRSAGSLPSSSVCASHSARRVFHVSSFQISNLLP